MGEHCHFLMLPESKSFQGAGTLPDVLKFMEQFRSIAGRMHRYSKLACACRENATYSSARASGVRVSDGVV